VVLGARVYIPALGRWLSPDPAGIDNPYVYAGDNPETATDPTGKDSQFWAGVLTVAFVVADYFTGGSITPWEGAIIGAAEGFSEGMVASDGNWRAGGVRGALRGGDGLSGH
jgi:uncharacterized protein RhaS with RHS repeats